MNGRLQAVQGTDASPVAQGVIGLPDFEAIQHALAEPPHSIQNPPPNTSNDNAFRALKPDGWPTRQAFLATNRPAPPYADRWALRPVIGNGEGVLPSDIWAPLPFADLTGLELDARTGGPSDGEQHPHQLIDRAQAEYYFRQGNVRPNPEIAHARYTLRVAFQGRGQPQSGNVLFQSRRRAHIPG